ncbi:DUF1801 domain-containing protein [Geodermatophilus sp. SYSU D00691]
MSALEEYLAGVDEAAHGTVRALDAVIRRVEPDFDVAVKYRLLMYTLDAKWRQWVVAVGASTKGVQLRFLWGVLMDDPRKVLRAGSSTLMTWDFAFGAEVDADAVAAYVREALARRDAYLADAQRIAAEARARNA